jgi:hypothetical protein
VITTAVALAAVTVSVDEPPAVIDAGLAAICTVTAGVVDVTVTTAVAVTVPPVPDAFAVYVVVAAGVTAFVPPVEDIVYELPSVPVTATVVALLAAMVSVEEAPAAIDAGLAVTVTAGVVCGGVVRCSVPPHPATTARSRPENKGNDRSDRCGRQDCNFMTLPSCFEIFKLSFPGAPSPRGSEWCRLPEPDGRPPSSPENRAMGCKTGQSSNWDILMNHIVLEIRAARVWQ